MLILIPVWNTNNHVLINMKRLKGVWSPGSETRIILTTLKKNRLSFVGISIIISFIFIAIFGPFIAPYDPIEMHLDERLLQPNREFLLGTDEFGRDTLSRIIYGARVALLVSITTVVLAMCIGILIGSVSGYYGGKIDLILMRLVDIVTSFPYIVLAVGVMAVLGRGIDKLLIVLPLTYWTAYARIVRGLVLSIKKMDYIEAAKAIGASNTHIIISHILVNVFPPSIVVGTFQLGSAILTETSLSYLGLGINPPAPSWGGMLSRSREYILKAPLQAIIPGLAITVVILGFNLLGDALRDALDPRLRV